MLPITNGVPGTAQTVSNSLVLYGVACPVSTLCEAVGEAPDSGGGILAPIVNGTIGSADVLVPNDSLQSVGCPSSTTCLVVTGYARVVPLTAPATSVGVPSNGANLAGSLFLDAAASDNLGVTQVNYVLTGGSTYNDTVISGSTPTWVGWLGGWNTTTVPNGTYTLQSVATDVEGFTTTSAPITVTVNNQPPTTAVGIPSNGATLSGPQFLDASASSLAGIASVSFELTGGTYNDTVISGSTPTIFGWLGGWYTTTVPNGTYILQSVATDVHGVSTSSAPVTITVDNPPPTTFVGIPSNGATLSGPQFLDAGASPGVTKVVYELTGGTLNQAVIATATPTYYGWLAGWDTTTVPNGTYTLQSVASYAGGVSGTSPGVTITVANHTVTFHYNGTNGSDGSAQYWTVPPGVTSIRIDAFGAQGTYAESGGGGLGGEASGTLAVSPGQVLSVVVGGIEGFNGGGPSPGSGGVPGPPGGGASDVRVAPYGLADRVIVGGGGGGGPGILVLDNPFSVQFLSGGAGGWPAGGGGALGGTSSSGGAGGSGGGPGTLGAGGAGAPGDGAEFVGGGGGGGGYYGGGGGGFDSVAGVGEATGPGGGGSSFFIDGCSSAACPSGVNSGDGYVTITYGA